MTTKGRFLKPSEIETPPGAEGWEDLYTYNLLFSADRREAEEDRAVPSRAHAARMVSLFMIGGGDWGGSAT